VEDCPRDPEDPEENASTKEELWKTTVEDPVEP
jgi:hypothetical protein